MVTDPLFFHLNVVTRLVTEWSPCSSGLFTVNFVVSVVVGCVGWIKM
jgi:hypothetical protein